jgi:hypothetical protein
LLAVHIRSAVAATAQRRAVAARAAAVAARIESELLRSTDGSVLEGAGIGAGVGGASAAAEPLPWSAAIAAVQAAVVAAASASPSSSSSSAPNSSDSSTSPQPLLKLTSTTTSADGDCSHCMTLHCGGVFQVLLAFEPVPAPAASAAASASASAADSGSAAWVRLQQVRFYAMDERPVPWKPSSCAFFQRASQHAADAWRHFAAASVSAGASSTSSVESALRRLVQWLQSYARDPFGARCRSCGRRLLTEGRLGLLPPTFRSYADGVPYHASCMPPDALC